jgi:phosphoribosylanthranilate isomerase
MFAEQRPRAGNVFVKICGITNFADAMRTIDAGADALGFNFSPRSRRRLDRMADGDWLSSVPASVLRVAILTNPVWQELVEISDFPFIDAIQLHGEETPAFCHRLMESKIRFAKAVPVTSGAEIPDVSGFFTDTVLLDSKKDGRFGGTGQTFDWSVAKAVVRDNPGMKVIVSGGLKPGNVTEAVRTIAPYGVDVASGVELESGAKDPKLVEQFISAARGA